MANGNGNGGKDRLWGAAMAVLLLGLGVAANQFVPFIGGAARSDAELRNLSMRMGKVETKIERLPDKIEARLERLLSSHENIPAHSDALELLIDHSERIRALEQRSKSP